MKSKKNYDPLIWILSNLDQLVEPVLLNHNKLPVAETFNVAIVVVVDKATVPNNVALVIVLPDIPVTNQTCKLPWFDAYNSCGFPTEMDVNVLVVLNSTNNPSFVTPVVFDNHQVDSQLFEYG